jgi:integrase
MRVPTVLRGLLSILSKGKQSNDYLFKVRDRHWVLRSVRRLCREAGVPSVWAHVFEERTRALPVEAGLSGDVVAKSLGHESFGVTTDHYAGAGAVGDAAAAREADALK